MKDYMLKMQDQMNVGRQIAVDAGVLKTCEFHDEVLYKGGDKTPAYILGNKKLKAGELVGVFDSPREMTDSVLKAIEDSPSECYRCEKWKAE